MTTAAAVLAKARTQLGGYYPGVSPYGSWYGAKVGAYQTYAAAQFCGMFVSWVADQVGALDIIPLHAFTPSGAAWFRAKGQWHAGKTGARPGDIVYFDFPGAPDRISHVGIVESVNSDGSLNTIEGNTSSTVGGDQRNGRTVARKRRASSIVGYGRPAYAAAPKPTPAPSTRDEVTMQVTIGKLRKGDRGPDVRLLQGVLNVHRAGVVAGVGVLVEDGIFGTRTDRALRAHQAAHRIAVDGVAGVDSWRTLLEDVPA